MKKQTKKRSGKMIVNYYKTAKAATAHAKKINGGVKCFIFKGYLGYQVVK